jgi:hypothetical protein
MKPYSTASRRAGSTTWRARLVLQEAIITATSGPASLVGWSWGCSAGGETGTAALHTLNGAATAVGRPQIAILKIHQHEDASVAISEGAGAHRFAGGAGLGLSGRGPAGVSRVRW